MTDLPPLQRYFEAHRDEMGSPYLQTLLKAILNELDRLDELDEVDDDQ